MVYNFFLTDEELNIIENELSNESKLSCNIGVHNIDSLSYNDKILNIGLK